jgi:hypothetical protein
MKEQSSSVWLPQFARGSTPVPNARLHFGGFGDLSRDLDIIRDAIPFEVVAADLLGTGMLPRPIDGPVFWPATWTFG